MWKAEIVQPIGGEILVKLEETSIELSKIHKQNAKSVLKKLAIGIYTILAVGVVAYALLFLIMIIM